MLTLPFEIGEISLGIAYFEGSWCGLEFLILRIEQHISPRLHQQCTAIANHHIILSRSNGAAADLYLVIKSWHSRK